MGHCPEPVIRKIAERIKKKFKPQEYKEFHEYPCTCGTVVKAGPHPAKKLEAVRSRRSAKPGEKISIDLLEYEFGKGTAAAYGLVIVDNATRFTWLYELSHKNQIHEALKRVYEKFRTQLNARIQTIKSDNETSISKTPEFEQWAAARGIHVAWTQKGTSQQNGIAECKIRELRKMAKQLLAASQLPEADFHVHAIAHAVLLGNIRPKSALGGNTPYEDLKSREFPYKHLAVFGTLMARKKTGQRHQGELKGSSDLFVNLGNHKEHPEAYRGYSITSGKVVDNVHRPSLMEVIPKNKDWLSELRAGGNIEALFLPEDSPSHATQGVQEPRKQSDEQSQPSVSIEGVEAAGITLPGAETDSIEIEELEEFSDEETGHIEITELTDAETDELADVGDISDGYSTANDAANNLSSGEDENEVDSTVDQVNQVALRRSSRRNFGKREKRLIEEFMLAEEVMLTEGEFKSEDLSPIVMEVNHLGITTQHETILQPINSYPPVKEIANPKNEREAAASPYHREWAKARGVEMANLFGHKTFEIVDSKPTTRLLGTKFVYVAKGDQEGKIVKFKARLVARGFEMIYNRDYRETYAPVAKETTIKWLLAWGHKNGFTFYQVDYHGAFLHSVIPEEFQVHIKTPRGTEIGEGKVLRCVKGLYGLKNAGHLWIKDLTKSLLSMGFEESTADQSLFLLKEDQEIVCAIAVWVDDLMVACRDTKFIDKFVKEVEDQGFVLSSIGDLEFFLGMKIEFHDDRTVTVSQRAYIEDMLTRFGFQGHGKHNPLPPEKTLSHRDMPEPESKDWKTENVECTFEVRQAVGALYHLARWSLPEILFAVNHISQFQTHSKAQCWPRICDVMAYISANKTATQTFGKKETPMIMFVDANFGGCARHKGTSGKPPSLEDIEKMDDAKAKAECIKWMKIEIQKTTHHIEDVKSQYGYVCFFYGGPGSYRSKKITTITQSSTEAEILGLNEAIRECLYLRKLCDDFGVTPNNGKRMRTDPDNVAERDPMIVFEDNNGAKATAEKRQTTQRNKQLAIREFWCAEKVKERWVKVESVKSSLNVADIMTKPLHEPTFRKLRGWLRGIDWPEAGSGPQVNFD